MDNEQMKAVFTELLEEQKDMNRSQAETTMAIQQLTAKMEAVENATKNRQSAAAQIDLKPFQESIERKLSHIQLCIDLLMQKPSSNNLRIFMESDAKKWAVYLLVAIIFLTYLYCLATRKA